MSRRRPRLLQLLNLQYSRKTIDESASDGPGRGVLQAGWFSFYPLARARMVDNADTQQSPAVVDQGSDASALESFFSTILTPGSSLHPTFQIILDSVVRSTLRHPTHPRHPYVRDVHIFALLLIELALWGV
ncbi:hypothetical protein NMY22_g14767 [Coprinellus aureogranulatus]|nr:hypothetical protein NMY22_g14767 [Coprinellus aureogranulatus]